MRQWWLISISGYGKFGFFGSADEAEETRYHKAQWESGVGKAEPILPDHPEALAEVDNLKWQKERGYPLDERQLDCLRSSNHVSRIGGE